MKYKTAPYLLALGLLCLSPAMGTAQTAQQGTQVSLSASASEALANNEVVVRLHISAEGKQASGLREKVNRISRDISARLAREKGVKLQTTGRRLEAINHYDKAQRRSVRDGWHLVQSSQVVSQQLDQVADWLDDIEQAGARLDGLTFRISDALRESKTGELRLKAVQQFRNKAAAMARALDAASYRIINIRTAAGSPALPRMQRAVMAMSADAPPALNSGESRLSVRISGEIQLPEKAYSAQ